MLLLVLLVLLRLLPFFCERFGSTARCTCGSPQLRQPWCSGWLCTATPCASSEGWDQVSGWPNGFHLARGIREGIIVSKCLGCPTSQQDTWRANISHQCLSIRRRPHVAKDFALSHVESREGSSVGAATNCKGEKVGTHGERYDIEATKRRRNVGVRLVRKAKIFSGAGERAGGLCCGGGRVGARAIV